MAPSVQKWIIDSDVENQLRSLALVNRLLDESLAQGPVELYLRFLNLTAIGWGKKQPFGLCPSLLRIDLSVCPKLESIPEMTFGRCRHLASVVFGEHSSITNIGNNAFQFCSALTSITLPDKLKIIEQATFAHCVSLERVVCNKNLKTIGNYAFYVCSKLADVQLASKSISFGDDPFAGCDRSIELAAAAGFPSNTFGIRPDTGQLVNLVVEIE